MIIDFTVCNYRSIKTDQTISFYAESSHTHLTQNIDFPIDEKLGVLKCAAIYGANASGKSNFLRALYALRDIVTESDDLKDGDQIKSYEPYRLCVDSKDAPTIFEIEFVVENMRFIYQVSFNAYEITHESLDYYPSRQKANLFKRKEGEVWNQISFGALYKGGKKVLPLFRNNSYLAKAGNSADTPEIIRKVYNFFRNQLVNEENYKVDPAWKKNHALVGHVGAILSNIDTGISNIIIKQEDNSKKLAHLPIQLPEHIKSMILDDFNHVPYFEHITENNVIELFSARDESSGTIALYNALPLIFKVLEIGAVLIFDEIENSLHPHIAELIVKLFNDPAVNTQHAQLLFTTHSMSLMSPELLRKDQIWLTEKKMGTTTITSLDNYDAATLKSNSPFSKWYNEGRLGAVPEINYHAISQLLTKKVNDDAQT